MKIIFFSRVVLMGAILAFVLTGFIRAFADDPARIPVPGPPPQSPPRHQLQSPNDNAIIWIKGHFEWMGGGWVWIEGAFVPVPRPNAHWVPGHYDDGYWYPGHWK
ncbi:MAG: hypothetical protein LV481_10715 [Methylacidiphilales bacterium]|nr:hypothetical protein [Candidatus Methylacidiphilales bacterium]